MESSYLSYSIPHSLTEEGPLPLGDHTRHSGMLPLRKSPEWFLRTALYQLWIWVSVKEELQHSRKGSDLGGPGVPSM